MLCQSFPILAVPCPAHRGVCLCRALSEFPYPSSTKPSSERGVCLCRALSEFPYASSTKPCSQRCLSLPCFARVSFPILAVPYPAHRGIFVSAVLCRSFPMLAVPCPAHRGVFVSGVFCQSFPILAVPRNANCAPSSAVSWAVQAEVNHTTRTGRFTRTSASDSYHKSPNDGNTTLPPTYRQHVHIMGCSC